MNKTYTEDNRYYAVVELPSGHTYYLGPYKSRSTARRVSIRETCKHRFAAQIGMIYNVRAL